MGGVNFQLFQRLEPLSTGLPVLWKTSYSALRIKDSTNVVINKTIFKLKQFYLKVMFVP